MDTFYFMLSIHYICVLNRYFANNVYLSISINCIFQGKCTDGRHM